MSDTRLIENFAAFAARSHSGSFPELARARAVDATIDCVGCILAGVNEPVARAVLASLPIVPRADGVWNAAVIGRGFASPADAARFHGAAAHALDYDDINHPAYAHPSAVLVPALLAAAPAAVGATGQDFVTAYIVGFEMMGKLGRVLNTAHYAKGWHATNTFGSLAAALAVGSLLNLSEAEIGTAIGIAASMAGGIRANFGTMVKPLHAGLAARAGVEAAFLARDGFDAAATALEHRFGYLAVFAGAEPPRTEFFKHPGEPLEILTTYGLALKPYPACGGTHPGIEAAIRLHDRLLPGEIIDHARVGVSALAKTPLIYDRPKTALEGKFSMEFCAAAALLDGAVTLQTFTDERVQRADVTSLIERTDVQVDDRVRDSTEFAAVIQISTRGGRVDEELVPLAVGKPERWMSPAMIEQKFRDCARYGNAEAGADAALRMLRGLDSNLPLASLTEAFATAWSVATDRSASRALA